MSVNLRCPQLDGALPPVPGNEGRALAVFILTFVTMGVEIVFGTLSGSMALLADGWHMGTHAFALGIAYAAFRMARIHSRNGAFSFGTGKFSVLSGYTSALFLGATGVWMLYESGVRLLNPLHIAYGEALLVAVLGLAVNVLSIFILGAQGHDHKHEHGHEHPHEHGHEHAHVHKHDHNYRAAYLHVLADALTSVLAIAALLCGQLFGWAFLDPVTGILGGIMILRWTWGLLHDTVAILLDVDEGGSVRKTIAERIEGDGSSKVVDLHVWRIGSHDVAALVSISGAGGRSVEDYRTRLAGIPDLLHLNVELSD